MKKWGIFIAAGIAIALVVVVAMHPRYRQRLLMSQLRRAPSAEEKARLIREIIDLDAESARENLNQYSQDEHTFAFDPRHVVGLVLDTTTDYFDIIGVNNAGRYSIGEKLDNVKLLESNDQRVNFVIQTNDKHGIPKYWGFGFLYDRGTLVDLGGFDAVSPDDITRWQTEGIWPF
jgi:hypothetical protein